MAEMEIDRRENLSDEVFDLPRFMALKSNYNNKYLSYTVKKEEENADRVLPPEFLKFSGEQVGSHYAKFEVEAAKNSDNKGLVHIRCCYNNKYWVSCWLPGTSTLPENDHWIVAAADEPEEDRSKSSCTLFEPIIHVEELNDQAIDDDYEDDDSDHHSNGDGEEDDQQQQDPVVIVHHQDPDVIDHINHDPDAIIDDPHQNNCNMELDVGNINCHDVNNGRNELANNEDHQVAGDDEGEYGDNANEDINNNARRGGRAARRTEINRQRMLVQLRHVHLGMYASLWKENQDAQHLMGGLYTSPSNPNSTSTDQPSPSSSSSYGCDVCTVIDWESLVILPKHVAFRGDELNGNLLKAEPWHLHYEGNDFTCATVAHEIFTNPNGTIRIKSDHLGKFWRRTAGDPYWICPDSDDASRNNNTLFEPIKIRDNEFALRNMGNNNICKRYSLGVVGLTANATDIPIYAHLGVEELVTSRLVYNVDYRLMHSRLYDYRNNVEIVAGEAVNLTQETTGITLKLKYKTIKTGCWNDAKTSSMKSGGVRTTLKGGVPVIRGDGKLEIQPCNFTSRIRWGEVEMLESAVESVCKVDVPAMSRVTVSLVADTASYDVPFNYSHRDIRTTREVILEEDKDDGIYTGVNTFNFKYNVEQQTI